jgi:hypothetical protein
VLRSGHASGSGNPVRDRINSRRKVKEGLSGRERRADEASLAHGDRAAIVAAASLFPKLFNAATAGMCLAEGRALPCSQL